MPENIVNCDGRGFWIDAHHYVINCNEPHFAQEIAFIMTTLHDEVVDIFLQNVLVRIKKLTNDTRIIQDFQR